MAQTNPIRPGKPPALIRQSGTHTHKPLVLAYILAFLSTTSPRLLQIALGLARGSINVHDAIAKIRTLLRSQLAPDQFPAACAILVGGATILPRLILQTLRSRSASAISLIAQQNARFQSSVTFCCSLVTALISFSLLNSRKARRNTPPTTKPETDDQTRKGLPEQLAGHTLSLTFFGTVRALDIVVSSVWGRYKAARKGLVGPKEIVMQGLLESSAAPCLFAASSFVVMWAWFHTPERLPRSYQKWISSAAQIDQRLIEALKQCRLGGFVYGKDTGIEELLGSMSQELGYPREWGDPQKTIPIPCELYHSGTGPNCEYHGLARFFRAWSFAMRMYVPLNLLMLLRKGRSHRDLGRVFFEAARSSTFLGSFVAFFYYGVCLARTRIGPKLFSRETVTPQMMDGGICVGTGCFACGWSILFEKPGRRNEIAFFVAPRALNTLFPRRYNREHIGVEQCAFALSAAVILTSAIHSPKLVRGVFGSVLGQILQA